MISRDPFYLQSLNEVASARQAPDIVSWAARTFSHDLVMSSSFGAESAAMIHIAITVDPKIRIIVVDTGYLFRETYEFMEHLRRRFDLNILVYRSLHHPQEYLADAGEADPDAR